MKLSELETATPVKLSSLEQAPTLAERASGAVKSLANATAETMLPPTSMEAAKRLVRPQAGQYGLSNLAQREGEKVQKEVGAISPVAAKVLPPLTPQSAQVQLGMDALMLPVSAALAPAGRFAANTAEAASGLANKAPGRLAQIFEHPSELLAPGREAAGEQFNVAKAGLGGSGRLAAIPKKTELLDTVGEMLSKGEQPTGGEALRARQAVDNELFNKNTSPYNTEWLEETRDKLDAIVKADPAMAEADAAYTAGTRASAARSLFPLKGAKGSLPGRLVFGSLTGGASELARVPFVQSAAAAALGASRHLVSPTMAAIESKPETAPQVPPTPFAEKLMAAIAAARAKHGK